MTRCLCEPAKDHIRALRRRPGDAVALGVVLLVPLLLVIRRTATKGQLLDSLPFGHRIHRQR
ncbi:hypothetical protein SAMN05421854_110131 [Amycolatopsis rubida]|uniref:Uncharacterized protein n=1 Tax=Amycolatopsis rubida TaxID=112413 RepID=A0A1I5XAW8_9PSEU|nr:hypothetical protein SAMN05421854_110131 [Amycolatopsis rubida]